jgi:hypothetical protein
MKAGRAKATKKSPYVRDEDPERRKVRRALISFVKGIVSGTKVTVNAWGVPTFEAPDPFFLHGGQESCDVRIPLRHFASGLRGAA